MTSSEITPTILLKPLNGADPIELTAVVIVGRGAACDVVIEQERLSRKHAQLTVNNNEVLVEDLGSTNSTFVNDVKTVGAVTAKHGDIIKFDSFAYRVTVMGLDEEDSTVAASSDAEVLVESNTQAYAAPKSWALDDTPSADGTLVMSLDELKKHAEEDKDAITAENIVHDEPVLICLNGDMKGKVFKFTTRDKITKWEIGRSADCDVCIDDGSVSTNHAQLIHEAKRWKLTDLMSSNGTFVNDNKGLSSYLKSGDMVRFGQVEFQFSLGEADKAVTAARATVTEAEPGKKSALMTWVFAGAGFLIAAAVLYMLIL
ncbi:FHA domain-containing protein [Dasania marina]|uniref:FHA domain-containing protein n=1 Tax=Dasania marina TaxID=471499 RepID=UPI000A01890D|nr:FHA domain-containing protein [Dasania marina]